MTLRSRQELLPANSTPAAPGRHLSGSHRIGSGRGRTTRSEGSGAQGKALAGNESCARAHLVDHRDHIRPAGFVRLQVERSRGERVLAAQRCGVHGQVSLHSLSREKRRPSRAVRQAANPAHVFRPRASSSESSSSSEAAPGDTLPGVSSPSSLSAAREHGAGQKHRSEQRPGIAQNTARAHAQAPPAARAVCVRVRVCVCVCWGGGGWGGGGWLAH